MAADPQHMLREQLVWLIRGGHAHLPLDEAVGRVRPAERGRTAVGFAHSPWQLVEHLRICQWDLLEFCRDGDHVSPDFPDGLWPSEPAPPTGTAWDECVHRLRADRDAFCARVADPATDLLAPLPWAQRPEQCVLREALILADHNAYHVGQLIVLLAALRARP